MVLPLPTLPPSHLFDISTSLIMLLSRFAVDPTESHSSDGRDLPAIKDVAIEAAAIKTQIQRAHAALELLPDLHRTIEEQQEEIWELKGKIEKQKETIGSLNATAKKATEEI